MPVEIDRGSLAKIARTAGEQGKVIPEWATGEKDLENAYYAGAGVTPPTPDPAPAKSPSPAPEKRPTPAKSGTKSPARSRAGAPVPASRRAPARQSSTSWKQRAASKLTPGSAGGVLLAAFIYPVLLAGLEAGPQGCLDWLAAKFLNKAPATSAPKASSNRPRIVAPGQSQVAGIKNGTSTPITKGPSA